MRAAVDVGSNTVRLLLGRTRAGRVIPVEYYRNITRLAGSYTTARGLAPAAMERTLAALSEIGRRLQGQKLQGVRLVGTEILRRAGNGPDFVRQVRDHTGLTLETISGETEAGLCAAGVRSALEPLPDCYLVFDIGGGSTEFILHRGSNVVFARSYPLGAVALAERGGTSRDLRRAMAASLGRLRADLGQAGLLALVESPECLLVGTAGTVTSLAALKLQLTLYDWRRINNMELQRHELVDLLDSLLPLSVAQREALPGLEAGRGDLIVPGLHLVLEILQLFAKQNLKVSDFGLLEGVLLSLEQTPPDNHSEEG